MKLYFQQNNYSEFDIDGACYSLEHFKKDRHLFDEDTILVEAKVEYNTGYFWCSEFDEAGESGESCGKSCDKYKPRNGVSGRCCSHKSCYEPTETRFRLTKNLRLMECK
jgi:hypothetical protein